MPSSIKRAAWRLTKEGLKKPIKRGYVAMQHK
jgi:hypothetical protein